MVYGKGLAYLKQQRESMPSTSFGPRINKLWLKDGQTAKFYFMWDHDEVPVIMTHSVKKVTANGKQFSLDQLCARETYSDPIEKCNYCMAKESGPFLTIVAPVWVDFIMYNSKPDGVNAKLIESKTQKAWKQEVNAMWLYPIKGKEQKKFEIYLETGGDILDPNPVESILGYAFTLAVTGEKTSKDADLKARPEMLAPDSVKEEISKRPNIDELILNEYGRPGGGSAKTPAAVKETVSYSTEDSGAASEADDVSF